MGWPAGKAMIRHLLPQRKESHACAQSIRATIFHGACMHHC